MDLDHELTDADLDHIVAGASWLRRRRREEGECGCSEGRWCLGDCKRVAGKWTCLGACVPW